MEEHALGIDVADFEIEGLAQTQAAGVDGGQRDAVIEGGDGSEDLAHLGGGEDDRELELRGGADQLDFGGPGAAEGFVPEHLDLPAGRQVAQMAWVEVERVKRRSVLR